MRITYDGNGYTGGTVPVDTTDYSAGDYAIVQAPGTMAKDGSTFAGWQNLSNTKTYHPLNKMMVFSPITLKAQWEPACAINYDMLNAINIEGIPPFDGRRYSIGDEAIIPPHDDLTALQAVVGEGDGRHIEGIVSLQGWRIITGAEADHEVLKAGDTFTVTGGRVVLQAIWAPNEISIAYEINGAEGDTPDVQTAFSARRVSLAIPTCIKAGHYFSGWQDMATGEVYEAGAEATFLGCTTLEAVWTPLVEYTVHYDTNGATGGSPPEDERIYHGDNVYLPDPSVPGGIYKIGYTFAGWACRVPEFLVFDPHDAFPITQNTTFYARWMPDDESLRRHVTYTSAEPDVALGGEPPIDYTDYVDGDVASAKTWSPLKLGRLVIGWKLDDTIYQFGDQVPIQGNITLVAVWAENPAITLKFSGGIDATGTIEDIICDCTGTVLLPGASTFSREGYFADGWIAPDGKKFESGTLIQVNPSDKAKVLEYTVNWISKAPEHTVTYFSIDHDSGHIPIDPCKYHAGEAIPLAPPGDLRKDGFELIGWDDVSTGKTYSIPSNEEIAAYCENPERPAKDSAIPMMWCTGDHMLRAHWVPVAQLFFGTLGATPLDSLPSPIRVRYKEAIRIPDSSLYKSGHTLVGWKDVITGIIYKVGDWYKCTGSEVLVLQPVFATASIVEYIIPPELNIVNAAWVPKNGYCVNSHKKQVIVPPEMEGNYCWVRSDTGERIAETCEIHDIYGDICLTLTPISMSNDGDDRWVWSTHVIAEGLTPMHGGAQRCGDLFEFPKNFGAGFSGWILNNDERRIYQPGEKIRIYGHAQIRAVYPNATHIVAFSYPEGTLAVPPADTEALAEGAMYQLPSGDGIRGPNGTKLLYWCGIDQTETEDDPDIIRKWYPGEYLRVPEATETIEGKMFNSAGKLVVYPQFGDKLTIGFADSDGAIMPEGGFTASGVYAEYQAVRAPQVTDLERSERTDAEWLAAWRIPYRAGSENEYVYAGMFGAAPPENSSNDLLSFAFIAFCGWVAFKVTKHFGYNIDDKIACWLEEEWGLQALTTLEYVYGDDVVKLKEPPVLKGLWYNTTKLPDANEYFKKPNYVAIGWRFIGNEGVVVMPPFRPQYQIHTARNMESTIVFGARDTCKWEIIWCPIIIVHFNLAQAWDAVNERVPGTREKYKKAINPRWKTGILQSGGKFARGINCIYGKAFPLPLGDLDFEYTNPYKNIPGCGDIEIYDRWYPREYRAESPDTEFFNPHLFNPALPDSEFDLYLDAHDRNDDPRNTTGKRPKVPNPENSPYSKYFRQATIKGSQGEEKTFFVITFDLRWARPEFVEYTYYREHRNAEQNKKANIQVTGRPKTHRQAFAPGEYPRVVKEDDLPEFRRWIVGEDDNIYYFKHWKIRAGSEMYQYYAEHSIPERDKEYTANDSLPYVRIDQPTMVLYLDADYSMREPPEPEEKVELGYGDEDNSIFTKLFKFGSKSKTSSKNKTHTTLKTINAFSSYQQNASNAQQKAQHGGILNAIIAGAKALTAIASAVGGFFDMQTHLRNDAPELRLNDQNKVEEIELITLDANQEEPVNVPVSDLNKEIKQQTSEMRQFQASAWRDYEQRPPTSIDEISKLTHLATLDYPVVENVSPTETKKIELASEQAQKLENLKLGITRQDDDYYADDETDTGDDDIYEVKTTPVSPGFFTKLIQKIGWTRGYTGMTQEEIKQKAINVQMESDMLALDFGVYAYSDGYGLIGTPSPHQLQENTTEYVGLKYVPRDPTDTNWYTVGDTVPQEEGKVPVLVQYMTFANEYDDNAPDSETHTVDETYYEPHETVTVKECAAEAPDGMEFAGWILDENETTRSIVQPGDTLVQDTCNHTFKALWLPEDPTRFPGLREPSPLVPNKPDPYPDFIPFPVDEEATE